MKTFPLFIQWLEMLGKASDEEFESISKAWPAPTKTQLAWTRAEMKAMNKFLGGGN